MKYLDQVTHIYLLNPEVVKLSKKSIDRMTDIMSEEFTMLLVNRQIELFGINHRDAYASAFLGSRGIQLRRESYSWMLEEPNSTKLFELPIKQNLRNKRIAEYVNSFTSDDFIHYEIQEDKPLARKQLFYKLDRLMRDAWGTSCKFKVELSRERPFIPYSEGICSSYGKLPQLSLQAHHSRRVSNLSHNSIFVETGT